MWLRLISTERQSDGRSTPSSAQQQRLGGDGSRIERRQVASMQRTSHPRPSAPGAKRTCQEGKDCWGWTGKLADWQPGSSPATLPNVPNSGRPRSVRCNFGTCPQLRAQVRSVVMLPGMPRASRFRLYWRRLPGRCCERLGRRALCGRSHGQRLGPRPNLTLSAFAFPLRTRYSHFDLSMGRISRCILGFNPFLLSTSCRRRKLRQDYGALESTRSSG